MYTIPCDECLVFSSCLSCNNIFSLLNECPILCDYICRCDSKYDTLSIIEIMKRYHFENPFDGRTWGKAAAFARKKTTKNILYNIGEEKMANPTWEKIACDTQRLKVFEGWLVRVTSYNGSYGVTFVPDRDHHWEVEKEAQDFRPAHGGKGC